MTAGSSRPARRRLTSRLRSPSGAARESGQPVKTLTQPLGLSRGETALPRAYVYCTVGKEPDSPQARRAEQIKSDPRWTYRELHTGHTLQYTAPEETVRILSELVGR